MGNAENVAYVGAICEQIYCKVLAGTPEENRQIKSLGVDGERIVRLVFRKLT